MKTIIIGALLILIGILGALYIGIWWGLVEPILNIANAVDNETWTASLIGWEICKFFLKEILASLWAWLFISLGMISFHLTK